MAMGGAVASLAKHHERPFHAIEGIEWPFMILFFVLAGASLEIGALQVVGGVTGVYILSRGIGIYVGTRSGCRLAGVGPQFQKWLGIALFPQAGVAIGMALLASQRFPEFAAIVLPVVLGSTIILELFSPLLTRYAIRAAESG
jgi:Kef-type K+ transport system membrane component KefB